MCRHSHFQLTEGNFPLGAEEFPIRSLAFTQTGVMGRSQPARVRTDHGDLPAAKA